MAQAFQNTLTFNHCKINYGWICFLKLDNAVSLLPKKPFLPVLDTKPFFAIKIINHHEKQITPSESWDQDSFFKPGFRVSSHSNHWARIFTTLWPPNHGEHLDSLFYNLNIARFTQKISQPVLKTSHYILLLQTKIWHCPLLNEHCSMYTVQYTVKAAHYNSVLKSADSTIHYNSLLIQLFNASHTPYKIKISLNLLLSVNTAHNTIAHCSLFHVQ